MQNICQYTYFMLYPIKCHVDMGTAWQNEEPEYEMVVCFFSCFSPFLLQIVDGQFRQDLLYIEWKAYLTL